MDINYVLHREKERKYCNECHAMWIIFAESETTEGVYRFGAIPPEHCRVCAPIDKQIEEGCIMSHENWVEVK